MSIVKVLGVPSSAGCRAETSTVIDQHNAPASIRSAFKTLNHSFAIPVEFTDVGDTKDNGTVPSLLDAVEQRVEEIVKVSDIPVILGGVHTLTLGALRAVAKYVPDFSLIYIDAHPDIMPHPQINYGSLLFFALQEEIIHPERMALLGVRQVENPEYEVLRENKIFHLHAQEFEVLGAKGVLKQIQEAYPPPYYISIDLDSIDQTFAPGVTCPHPGGLTSREVIYLAEQLCSNADVLGVDIVEHSPLNDQNEMTAKLAAHLLQVVTRALSARVKRH